MPLSQTKGANGILSLLHIPIEEQLADFLTEPLPPPKFNSFVSKLGMINIYHAPACGRLLKHSLEDVESHMLKDKEEEHTAHAAVTFNTSLLNPS